ncbi:hypothetical protein NUL63_004572 [Salmonella enterica]|nr:hypothetical protein [Salmonella enterica]
MFKPEIDAAAVERTVLETVTADWEQITAPCALPVEITLPGNDSHAFGQLFDQYRMALVVVETLRAELAEVNRAVAPLEAKAEALRQQIRDINTEVAELTAERQRALAAGERPAASGAVVTLREDAAYVQQLLEQQEAEINGFLIGQLQSEINTKTRDAMVMRRSLIFAVSRERSRQLEGALLESWIVNEASTDVGISPFGASIAYVVNGNKATTAIESWKRDNERLTQQELAYEQARAARQQAQTQEPTPDE